MKLNSTYDVLRFIKERPTRRDNVRRSEQRIDLFSMVALNDDKLFLPNQKKNSPFKRASLEATKKLLKVPSLYVRTRIHPGIMGDVWFHFVGHFSRGTYTRGYEVFQLKKSLRGPAETYHPVISPVVLTHLTRIKLDALYTAVDRAGRVDQEKCAASFLELSVDSLSMYCPLTKKTGRKVDSHHEASIN